MLSGRLLFDVTKACRQKHKSGILRVSSCLKAELSRLFEDRFVEVVWSEREKGFRRFKKGGALEVDQNDVLLTSELFCETERPGIENFLKKGRCRSYAIFHDAIPLRFPEFTWPRSVQRHPCYMKMLSLFDGVFGVSQSSSIQLEEYWEWLGFEYAPSVKSIQLGADGVFSEASKPKVTKNEKFSILMLGIIEIRKGQDLALDACTRLWDDGLDFNLHVVGRTNPHFGKDIERRLKRMAKENSKLVYHGPIDDSDLQKLFEEMDLKLFPSRAEGCGLPVLESLWKGLPVLCARLSSVRETARFGGCQFFEPDNLDDLSTKLKGLVLNPEALDTLRSSIDTTILPRWRSTSQEIYDNICPREAFAEA